MNQHDQDNLLFLMSLDTLGLERWFVQASENDRSYAEQLLAQAQVIVAESIIDKLAQEAIDFHLDCMESFPEAQKVLDKVMR